MANSSASRIVKDGGNPGSGSYTKYCDNIAFQPDEPTLSVANTISSERLSVAISSPRSSVDESIFGSPSPPSTPAPSPPPRKKRPKHAAPSRLQRPSHGDNTNEERTGDTCEVWSTSNFTWMFSNLRLGLLPGTKENLIGGQTTATPGLLDIDLAVTVSRSPRPGHRRTFSVQEDRYPLFHTPSQVAPSEPVPRQAAETIDIQPSPALLRREQTTPAAAEFGRPSHRRTKSMQEDSLSSTSTPNRQGLTASISVTGNKPETTDPLPQSEQISSAARERSPEIQPFLNDTREQQEKVKRRNYRTCCLVTVLVVFLAAIAGCIALVQQLVIQPNSVLKFKSVATVIVKVDDRYQAEMSDVTSEKFQQYQNKFCYNVEQSLKDRLDTQNCTIISLSNGSIVVNFTLEFISDANMTRGDLWQYLTGTKGSGRVHLGCLQIFENSIQASIEITVTVTPSTKLKGALPLGEGDFDCSARDNDYLPLPYTYPGFCGEYQLCKNGKPQLFSCADGHEFAYISVNDTVVCDKPSNSTYCGSKRLKALSERSTTVSAVSGQVDPCPSFKVDTLYTCPPTGVHFIPRTSTYPDNCDVFTWCADGKVYNSSHFRCAAGTHFTMTLSSGPCTWPGASNTFCSLMTKRVSCQDREGDLPSSESLPITTTPGGMPRFSCAGVSNGFLPLSDTYPHKCGAFQQCVNGTGYAQSCPGDLLFTLKAGFCLSPDSNNTYCSERSNSP